MTDSNFYIGREYDSSTQTVTKKNTTYDPSDLTTHAVVTGMTGSGKTGLCIGLLEEAALKGIPAIIIDPKGDLTNLLLHFPDLAPQDFQPWIDADLARRVKKTPEQVATETANLWRKGLSDWAIQPERILDLKSAVQFAIYTPGSDSGIPISVLSSLASPNLPWQENREILREKISSTVTALLGLVGYEDIDPIRSREHIWLSNIFESSWSRGRNVDFTELVLQIQSPPFDKIGAFSIDKFFPDKDRAVLAMALNSIIASPAFEPWREGRPFDIQEILFTEAGLPKHSVFYLAHLSDNEKMFFVTLLLSAFETWMRTQNGTSALRALVYMDEIYGYLPPVSNPPSKFLLLRMLKQARAFGVGLILATQNPADVDYKGISNAGTWFIGKLQTEQDKNRLLDGLESASGGAPRSVIDKLLSSLGKRVFVMHNVHAKQPVLFQTRWTMNYLAGPLTRNRIRELNQLANSDVKPAGVVPRTAVALSRGAFKSDTSITKPPVPLGIKEYYLPTNLSLSESFRAAQKTMPGDAMIESVVYRPTLLASAHVRVLDRKLGVDNEVTRAALVQKPERRGSVRWEDYISGNALENVETVPTPGARFGTVDAPLNDTKLMTALQKDFADWLFRNSSVQARANTALKVYAGPDVSQAEFMRACADAARDLRDKDIAKQTAPLDRQLKTLEDKLTREERELREDEAELSNRKVEEAGTHLENLTGLFGGRRKASRLSSSLTKRRMTEQAKSDVEESIQAISQYKQQIAEVTKRREQMVTEINDKWGRVVNENTEVTVNPKKTDIFIDLFGVAWMPYYNVSIGGTQMELPAFATG